MSTTVCKNGLQKGCGPSRPAAFATVVDPKGVVCPKCGCAHLPVLNTRRSMGRIVRYRQCRHCGRRVTTYEVKPSKLADVTA